MTEEIMPEGNGAESPAEITYVAAAVRERVVTPDLAKHSSVAIARSGFSADQSFAYRAKFNARAVLNAEEGFRSQDENVYFNLHWDDVHPVNLVRRAGAILDLPRSASSDLAFLEIETQFGRMPLIDLLNDPRSRIQGFVVEQGGSILFEHYPGMRENDNHLWFSVSKTLPSTVLAILESQGRLDVKRPLEFYVVEAKGTRWEGIPIIDILDMASGLDVAETPDTMLSPEHKVNQLFRVIHGEKIDNGKGGFWTNKDLILAMDKARPTASGTVFEYSSINTQVLVMIVEAILGQRFSEILSDYVWSVIGAEGDALMGVTAEGEALSGGMMNSRLRDLVRYGMLFTPTGRAKFGLLAATAWGLPSMPDFAARISESCRPELYGEALAASEGYFAQASDADVMGNSWQWDMVYRDGDMFKGGVGGQGLYVSPDRDVSIAFFSTGYNRWANVARTIALTL